MSVATHLKIGLADYDRRVRTFIPEYSKLLDATSKACGVALHGAKRPTVIDAGVGTGALAARCLEELPSAVLVGIDADGDILKKAMRRFARRTAPVTLICGDLISTALPPADAVVSTLTLHHLPTATVKHAFYKRCLKALRPGGVLVSGDCHPSAVAAVASMQTAAWIAHMRQFYTAAEVRQFMNAWADEDFYTTLEEELGILQHAGFAVDVTYRHKGFAVIVGVKP